MTNSPRLLAIAALTLLAINVGCFACSQQLEFQPRHEPISPKAYLDDNSLEAAPEAYYGDYYEKRGLGARFDTEGWSAEELKAASFLHASNIYFYFDSALLTADAKSVLGQKAARLKAFPQLHVLIGGHSDERGSEDYNLRLGERRAKAARDHLTSLGVRPEQLSIKSFGKKYPLSLGSDEAAWSQNRRDEFMIFKP